MESELRRAFRAGQAAPQPRPAAAQTADGTQDAVLRQFHHRVNNNMQLISSLLQLQANDVDNPVVIELLQAFAGRVRAIAVVQQRVGREGTHGHVDLKACLEALADTILGAHSKGVNVGRQLNLEPVTLGIDIAIPVGLIANELITNSLKHAFAGRKEGLMRVSLGRIAPDQIRLAIGDDGCGAGEGILEGRRLGMRLVKILTGQIRGQMEYKNENGSEFVLVFKDTISKSH